jgi:hypothetical protein
MRIDRQRDRRTDMRRDRQRDRRRDMRIDRQRVGQTAMTKLTHGFGDLYEGA